MANNAVDVSDQFVSHQAVGRLAPLTPNLLMFGFFKKRQSELLALSDSVHDEIKRLSAVGDEHAKREAYPDAIECYWAAWDLLPEPKTDWNAATWILAAIGDANYLSGDYAAGRDNLSNAMHCPGAFGNPFIHFRLGQCQFELGNLDRAADELMRTYMGSGRDLFDQHDPKYFQFLASRAKDIR